MNLATWTLTGVLSVLNTMIQVPIKLLISGLEWSSKILQNVIAFMPSEGGYPVYTIWKILRDMCNMGFIILIIAVSFATIFNFKWKTAFYWKSALPNIIIAALLLNLSLPIGQTIITAGNKASTEILNLMGGKNIGTDILEATGIVKIIGGAPVVLPAPPAVSIPLDKLGGGYRGIVEGWYGKAQSSEISTGKIAATQALNALSQCINAGRNANDCYSTHALRIYNDALEKLEAEAKAITDAQERVKFLEKIAIAGEVGQFATQVGLAISNPANFIGVVGSAVGSVGSKIVSATTAGDSSSVTGEVTILISSLGRAFLVFVLFLSMLTIIIFMVMRIPALWFLLAVSATAFFAYGIPGNKWFKDWFGYMAGWTIFGPVYLAIIYFGLFILQQQSALTSSLAIQDLPFFSSTLTVIMFFAIICVIFMGGAAWAFKFSFSFVPKGGGFLSAESLATGISSILGTGEKGGYGVTQTSRMLGIQPAFEGAIAGIEKRYERVIKQPFQERQKRIKEGVSTTIGGGPEREEYLKKQLEAKKKAIADRLTTEREGVRMRLETLRAKEQEAKMGTNARAINLATIARQKVEDEYKKVEKEQDKKLIAAFDGGSEDDKRAIGETLMERGSLDVAKMRELQLMFAKLSPVAGQAYLQRRDKKLTEEASKRKYKSGEEFQQYMDLIGDDKKAKEFFDAGLRGNNKVWAIVAGTQRKLITDAAGKSMSLDAAMEKNADSFNAIDVARAEKYYFDAGETAPEKVSRRINKALYSPKERRDVFLEATVLDKEQNGRPQITRVRRAFSQFRKDAIVLQKKIYDKQVEVNRARADLKRLNTPANFSALQQREKEFDDLTDRARELGIPYGSGNRNRNRGNQNNPPNNPPPQPTPPPAAAPVTPPIT